MARALLPGAHGREQGPFLQAHDRRFCAGHCEYPLSSQVGSCLCCKFNCACANLKNVLVLLLGKFYERKISNKRTRSEFNTLKDESTETTFLYDSYQ